MMIRRHFQFLAILALAVAGTSCSRVTDETKLTAELANSHIVPVDPSHFIPEALVGEIIQEERTLPDGSKVLCYVIQTYSEPLEHAMGPWAPKTITDGKESGGLWIPRATGDGDRAARDAHWSSHHWDQLVGFPPRLGCDQT